MGKTIELTVTCEEIRIVPTRYNQAKAVLENPDIEEMLKEVKDVHIISHIRSEGYKPDEIFDVSELENWAEANGYIKENN